MTEPFDPVARLVTRLEPDGVNVTPSEHRAHTVEAQGIVGWVDRAGMILLPADTPVVTYPAARDALVTAAIDWHQRRSDLAACVNTNSPDTHLVAAGAFADACERLAALVIRYEAEESRVEQAVLMPRIHG